MILDQPDGTLYIIQTDECASLVIYENRFAPSFGDQFEFADGLTIFVIKGDGRTPEELRVRDIMTGQVYAVFIEEDATGSVCVPFPAIG